MFIIEINRNNKFFCIVDSTTVFDTYKNTLPILSYFIPGMNCCVKMPQIMINFDGFKMMKLTSSWLYLSVNVRCHSTIKEGGGGGDLVALCKYSIVKLSSY